MTNGTSDTNRYGRGSGAAQPQPPAPQVFFDQRTGTYVDVYGRPVQVGQAQPGQQPSYQQAGGRFSMQMPTYAAATSGGQYHAPVTSQPQQLKKKRGKGFWVGIAIAVLAIVAAAIVAAVMIFGGGESSRSGTLGQLEGKTDAEIQAELNRVVEEGMFNISIASTVDFPNGTEPGELRIENVPGNIYLMKVTIARDDNGEVVYESGILDPNYHIQQDTLTVDLDPGVYPCTATFQALDPETEQEVGTAGASITVNVLG